MTREDIIRLAREAGIPIETDWAGRPSTLVVKDGGTYLRGIDDLERFAALVAEHKQKELDRIFNVLCQISMLTDLGGEVAEYQDVVEAVKRIADAEREAIIDIVAFHGGSVEIEADIRARGQSPLVTPRGSMGEEV